MLPPPTQLRVRVHLHGGDRVERTPVRVERTVPEVEQVDGQAVGDEWFRSLIEEPKAPLPAR